MRVIVIGGGIVGTLTAYRIRKRFPDIMLKIVADKLSPHTTSDIAAGWLEPHLDPDTPDELTCKWAGDTYHLCQKVWRGEPVAELEGIQESFSKCISLTTGIQLGSSLDEVDLAWRDIPTGFKGEDSMQGYSFVSYTLESSKLLPVLYKWLREHDVAIEQRKVNSFDDLDGECDVIVNCSGIWARYLANDPKVFPISGQVIKAKTPGIRVTLADWRDESWAYIIPNRVPDVRIRPSSFDPPDHTVLGSVDIVDNWDTTVRPENTEKILKNCSRLYPMKGNMEVIEECVGLRPCRKGGVRLELERLRNMKIIHNYGHGGSGITLSWGCAGDAVELLHQVYQEPLRSRL